MDLTNLIQTRNIAARNPRYEHNTTALALALLAYARKDAVHGYLVRSEQIHEDRGGSDITVHVLRGDEPILVMECKKNLYAFKNATDQIEKYMREGGFPNGMIICPERTSYLTQDDNFDIHNIREYDNTDVGDLQTLVEDIVSF